MGNTNIKKQKPKRRLCYFVLLFLLLALGVLFYCRWGAWFCNKPEMPYHTPDSISRLTLTSGRDFLTSRQLSWRMGERLEPASVLLMEMRGDSLVPVDEIKARGTIVETRGGRGAYYTASLSALRGGTTYAYRVVTANRQSPLHTFTMPSRKEMNEEERFIYIGDVQDAEGEKAKKMFHKLRYEVASQFRPHLLIGAGDQLDAPTEDCWQAWYKALDGWAASFPMLFATGNHEYYKRGFARELDPRWVAQYNFPAGGPKGFERRTYYVDFPLMRLIFIDTTDMNGIPSFRKHQVWLREALRSSSQPWQVVVFHHATECVRAGRCNLGMKFFIDPILQEEGADLVLQAHDHAYSRRSIRTAGDRRQTPAYVISASSPKTYPNGFDDTHDRLGSGMQQYQTIALTPTSLSYRSYEYDGGLYDAFEIRHQGKNAAHHMVIDEAKNVPERFRYKGFKKAAQAEQYEQDVLQRQQQSGRH